MQLNVFERPGGSHEGVGRKKNTDAEIDAEATLAGVLVSAYPGHSR